MQDSTRIYARKKPVSAYITIVGAVCIILISIYQVFFTKGHNVSLIFSMTWTIILLQIILLLLVGMSILKRPKELEILKHSLRIDDREIHYTDIEKVIVNGYFIQTVGIKLFKKKLVPENFCFRFKENEELRINELKAWSEELHIKISNETIIKWI